ncbi:putative multidrug resistance protein [Penicillium brasilianum]|uniref:Putative multidrug resistance protein n=1 Tax=Penicillium brasilianum TaxID=104259 RepID=A0A1S9RDK7_PENBI|nr:putative multidrug resistance protein [Penicillium brasilianum]
MHLIILTLPSSNLEIVSLILITIILMLEMSLLVTESQSKVEILKPPYKSLTPEELTGVLGRLLFWWINPILKEGYHSFLTLDDLPKVDPKLSSRLLRKRLILAWNQRSQPETSFTLPRVLFTCFRGEILSPIVPRLFLIVFRYSQPILISVTIGFVQKSSSQDKGMDSGYWLVVLATGTYCGIAMATSSYRHKLNRLQMVTRGALIGLIHARSLRVENSHSQDGKALTLLSADVDSVDSFAEMFHETWAHVVEVLVGTSLLARQIGWFSPLPLLIVFGCSRMSAYVAKHLQGRQSDWSAATQDRLAMMAAILGGIKSMKILGLEKATTYLVLNLRAREIAMSIRLRWLMVAYNASANTLGIFSPVLTLILFAVFRSTKDVFNADVVFTTIALLGLVTHPANMIMTIIPRAIASLANFERIQAYLIQGSFKDERVTKLSSTGGGTHSRQPGQRPAVVLENVKVQLHSNPRPVLQNVNFHINEGAIFICSGPVGSGKSTLAMAILGEIIPTEGRIAVTDKTIAFCGPLVWLPNVSIRDAICGSSTNVDIEWYQTVIQACSLKADLESLAAGDMTLVGSNGINVSGGQKSRIALARAVYSRSHIMVLDDPFSAIDGAVETNILNALLGPEGILRKLRSTVLLIVNGARYYPFADRVVLLSDTRVHVLSPQDDRLRADAQMIKFHVSQKATGTERPEKGFKSQMDGTRIEDAAEDASRRTGDMALYGYYFDSVGIPNILLMASCTAIYAFCLTFSQYILKWWIESNAANSWKYILSYSSLSTMALLATNGTMWSTHIVIAPRSGSTLHARLLGKIMNAPFSYFSIFEVGTILNKFGQDIQLVDKQLPSAFANLSTQIFKLLMQGIILFAVQPTMAMTLPFCSIFVYFIQRVYLRTSRQLRFMDLESKSILYASFIDTVDGIATIRAFGWEDRFKNNNIKKLDISQSPLYLLLCLQRWLNVVLDLLIAGIAVVLITSAVAFRDTATGTDIGIALNMIIAANTTLLRLVETWTTLETSLGAVARLRSVDQDTPSEETDCDYLEPSLHWPRKGSMSINHISAGYSQKAPMLRDVNMDIQPGQKVILCGRTGSGKSTLFLTLLRLLHAEAGSIEVDGVDISHLPVHIIRRRCFIAVPQDPFILPAASVRFNLDPYNEHQDGTILEILEKTGLWLDPSTSQLQNTSLVNTANVLLQGLPYSDFLSQPLASFLPASTGQMQMFAFAQALLRVQPSTSEQNPAIGERKPIIIFDEAGSSLDLKTEAKMQELMKEYFADPGHTVITIAHRLNNVREDLRPGLDSVVWMEDGHFEELQSYIKGTMDTGRVSIR